jgi:hypothetical protein
MGCRVHPLVQDAEHPDRVGLDPVEDNVLAYKQSADVGTVLGRAGPISG